MSKGHVDTLLGFQMFFISRSNFSYFGIFSASVLGKLCVKGTVVSITSAVLFSLSMGAVSGLLKSTAVSVMIDMSQYKTVLADSSTSCGLYLQCSGVFLSNSLYFMAICWRIIVASWLCIPRYEDSGSDEHPAINVFSCFAHFIYSASVDDVHS